MGETLTKEENSEDISLEDAQEISDKLGNLRDKKRERIKEEIQDSESPKNVSSRCTKIGTVNEIKHLERESIEDEVRIDIEYVNNAETEVESFIFKVPEDEKDIHVDNRLIRFINFVGDGSIVDLNKVMYRDVPLIIDEDGNVGIDIPKMGKIARTKNTLKRRSIDISNKLDNIGVSIDSKSISYGITSILCIVVGFFAFQTSVEAGLGISESGIELLMTGLLTGVLTAIPIGIVSFFIGGMTASRTESNSQGDYAFAVSFTLLFLMLGVFSVNNGIILTEESSFIEISKFSSGFILPLLSLIYSYIFLSKLNIKTHIMSKYRRISKRLKLNKGPEYLE
jgi:hypothetical protein